MDHSIDRFKFIQPKGTLELLLQPPQQLGWTVYPERKPMEVCMWASVCIILVSILYQLLQSTVNEFPLNPLYSSCSMSVYAEIGVAKKPLHCPIELTGIIPAKTVYIIRSLPPSAPSSNS